MYVYRLSLMTATLTHVSCTHFICVSQTELVRFGRVHSDDEDEFAYNAPSELMVTELAVQRTTQSEPVRKTKVYIIHHTCVGHVI